MRLEIIYNIVLICKSNVGDLYLSLIFTPVLLHIYFYPGLCLQSKQVYACLVISFSSSINALLKKANKVVLSNYGIKLSSPIIYTLCTLCLNL